MPKMHKDKQKTRRYSPYSDTRRYLDGVRMHEYLGYILMEGRNHLLRRYPDQRMSRADFSRAALPVLKELGLVVLIDPVDSLPEWLTERERKLAMRGDQKPIWMPTRKMPLYIWNHLVSEIQDGNIVWPTIGQKPRKSKKPASR